MHRGIRIGVVIILLIVVFVFFENNSYNFEKSRKHMENIAEEIAQGKYEISENGLIKLPKEYEYLADNGEVCLVLFDERPAVYFWTYRGMLGSSKGYIYILNTFQEDLLGKCSERFNFVNEEEICEGWYSVSTDD